jgi:hypothetical protein
MQFPSPPSWPEYNLCFGAAAHYQWWSNSSIDKRKMNWFCGNFVFHWKQII